MSDPTNKSSEPSNLTDKKVAQTPLSEQSADEYQDTGLTSSKELFSYKSSAGAGDQPQDGNNTGKKTNPAIQSYKDWRRLQADIRAYPSKARERMKDIEKQFSLYRLTFSSLSYKAPQIEEPIWDVYNHIVEKIPELEKVNQKRPLFLYTNAKLREMYQAWENISTQQDKLTRLLKKAPTGLEFYNRMVIYRERRRMEDRRREENQARIESAYESLKKALHYVESQAKGDEPVYFGNEILTLQDAQNIWNSNLTDILTMRDERAQNPDLIIERIRTLEEMVRDYPSLSKQVQRVGERFSRLIAYHDLLSSYGKRVIPQAEIARASAMMYEQIPELWQTGNYANLKLMLERVENFLNFYENTVELEVAIGERRRSGFSAGLPPMAMGSASSLSPLINVARVLVAAIDQRDRFMAGHSENVAKLAIHTARKLNWDSNEIEFLEIAALLHDIGKVSIPETVLTKVKPLSNEEWKMIQMHPYYGAQIIKQMNAFNKIIPWVYHHQEHWDGTGYPDRLAKRDIPKAASIISIAEAFTVMTSELPYREAIGNAEALDHVQSDAGAQFDPEVVEAFLEGFKEIQSEEQEKGGADNFPPRNEDRV